MSAGLQAESSLTLLERARAGDASALNELLQRYLPRLRRWATGRLPGGARDLLDTEDLVQETIIKTVRNLPHIELRDEGAFPAYLRQALNNKLRDAFRQVSRHPAGAELESNLPAGDPSPLEQAIGQEAMRRYEAALERLKPGERKAVVLRIELCYEYEQIAQMTGKPTAGAARVAVSRALARLSREMARGG